jgi:hypothetical protein
VAHEFLEDLLAGGQRLGGGLGRLEVSTLGRE